ncbi:MAG: mercury methylation corrinoid protein HgcA [Syntrophorhabdaceae bacterium]|nr:mercury methylation corrinoid protein HgcA [Syntrophorhabdaceae bacterium]
MDDSKSTLCSCCDERGQVESETCRKNEPVTFLFPMYKPEIHEEPQVVYKDNQQNPSIFLYDFVIDSIDTPSGRVPIVDTNLRFKDLIGSWKVRWGIGRMNYRVIPGIYGIGRPDETSPVFVTANYKMSFDRLRKALSGLNAWILVLDTEGINVWCAAGKGRFGTDEIIRQIEKTGLKKIVSHKVIIVPQLGATGVRAHEVKARTGFKVIYGPVRADDIKIFLAEGMKAKPYMRSVSFGFVDRIVLIPMELVQSLKYIAIFFVIAFALHLTGIIEITFSHIYPFIGAVIAGCVVVPAILPWLPGRAFSLKGWILGFLWAVAVIIMNGSLNRLKVTDIFAILMLLPPISAFLSLNFTGASTYTSLSGVKKEMRIAIPAIITSVVIGLITGITGFFIRQ